MKRPYVVTSKTTGDSLGIYLADSREDAWEKFLVEYGRPAGTPMDEDLLIRDTSEFLGKETSVKEGAGWDWISHGVFVSILGDIVDKLPGDEIVVIPGIYEVLSEYFNNEVLEEAAERYNHCTLCGCPLDADGHCPACDG